MKNKLIYLTLLFVILISWCLKQDKQNLELKNETWNTISVLEQENNINRNLNQKISKEDKEIFDKFIKEEVEKEDEKIELDGKDIPQELQLIKKIKVWDEIYSYYKDQKYVYVLIGEVFNILTDDIDNFEILEKWFAKDSDDIFYSNGRSPSLDVKTFKIYEEVKNINWDKVLAEDINYYIIFKINSSILDFKLKEWKTWIKSKFWWVSFLSKKSNPENDIFKWIVPEDAMLVTYRYWWDNCKLEWDFKIKTTPYTTNNLTKKVHLWDRIITGADYKTFECVLIKTEKGENNLIKPIFYMKDKNNYYLNWEIYKWDISVIK